jgi:DNA-binding transcriptional LysR family regulator
MGLVATLLPDDRCDCQVAGALTSWARGELVQILPDWSDERFPLFAYHPSRHLPPAKVRAFLDFVREISSTI